MSEELAYLAGLVDGEGYIGIAKNKSTRHHCGYGYTPMVKVAATDRRMVEYFDGRFAGGFIEHRIYKSDRWKDSYCWSIRNWKLVSQVLGDLRPYLRIKTEQADTVLKLVQQATNIWGRGAMPAEELARRDDLYARIRLLNHRGPPPAQTE